MKKKKENNKETEAMVDAMTSMLWFGGCLGIEAQESVKRIEKALEKAIDSEDEEEKSANLKTEEE